MTHTARALGELVTRIQDTFLDSPGLVLTTADAQARFDLDAGTCVELLEFLADAGVLARDIRGGRLAFLLRQGTAPVPGPVPDRRPVAARRAA